MGRSGTGREFNFIFKTGAEKSDDRIEKCPRGGVFGLLLLIIIKDMIKLGKHGVFYCGTVASRL